MSTVRKLLKRRIILSVKNIKNDDFNIKPASKRNFFEKTELKSNRNNFNYYDQNKADN